MELQDRTIEKRANFYPPLQENYLPAGGLSGTELCSSIPASNVRVFGDPIRGEDPWRICVDSIGTGGTFNLALQCLASFDSTGSVVTLRIIGVRWPAAPLLPVSKQVASIKSAFSLSMSQLAQTLRVGRPTIYSWFESDLYPDDLRATNKKRLLDLYELASFWNRLSSRPVGNYLVAHELGERSLIELLSTPALDIDRVHRSLRGIFAAMTASAKGKEETPGERLRRLGFAEAPSPAGQVAKGNRAINPA